MHFIYKFIYPYINIKNGKIIDHSKKFPKAFANDAVEALSKKGISEAIIYIVGKGQNSTLKCTANLKDSRQRLINIWGLYKAKYK